jgi:hypothetical protein
LRREACSLRVQRTIGRKRALRRQSAVRIHGQASLWQWQLRLLWWNCGVGRWLLHGVGSADHADMPRHETILGTLAVVVALYIEFHDGTDGELGALAVRQETVAVHEQVASKAIRVDEAPSSLE